MVTLKIAEAVIAKMSALGIRQAFSITGGAAMHLNDAAGELENLSVLYMHNEQACAMAAEGYARISKSPALVIATAGPGAINTLNGVFGAFTDSIPMVVLTGQARKNTQKNFYGLEDLRQLGDQEAPMLEMVRPITKTQLEITDSHTSTNVLDLIEEVFLNAVTGRPGPVWIEIPVDVQGKMLDFDEEHLSRERNERNDLLAQNQVIDTDLIFKHLANSKKPVLLLGTGVLLAEAQNSAIEFAERFNIPILTAWAHDVIPSTHPLFMGRPGTIGTRPGNFILQQSDLLITVGSRLNIRQTSYNYGSFAPKAYKVYVDIDESELKKPFPKTDLQVESDAKHFFDSLNLASPSIPKIETGDTWVNWCRDVNENYSIKDSDYLVKPDVINAYHLIPDIFFKARENSMFVCGNATACIVPFQTARLRPGMSLFSNSGSASMGYDLPAAIGASLADPNRPVVCFAGDGSIMMNIQELQTLSTIKSDFKLVILDNGGYLSIKQTQTNFFGRLHGTNNNSGISFPDFSKLARAFGLDVITLKPESWRTEIEQVLQTSGVHVIVAELDEDQEFMPRIKSRVINGEIQTPELDDMFPHISDEELFRIRKGPVL